MMRMLPVMAALDADQNGEISSDEIAKATQALKALDKNSDGKLTIEEIRPNMEGMLPGGRRPEGGGFGLGSGGTASGLPLSQSPTDKIDKIMDLDKNGDGRISTEEMPEGAQRMLGKADADSDGFLTRDEIEKVADTLPPLGAMGQGSNGSANARGRFGEGMGMFADGPAAMIDRLFRLDADKDGKLTAIAHETISHTSVDEEFVEQTGVMTRMMYDAPNSLVTHRVFPLNVQVPR